MAVLAFTALIYFRALHNGFAGLDDDMYILQNPFIRNFSVNGIKAIFTTFYNSNYHPLTMLAYLAEYTCFGINPMPYHLLNVSLHLINTWLVFQFIRKLSGKKPAALVVSILFAVHPMHVESVAWVSELKDMLYTFFYLLSLLVYLRYIDLGYRVKHFMGAVLFFSASLLSKSAAVTLPVLLIAIDVYKGRNIGRRLLLEKIPFFLLSLLFGTLAILSQQAGGALSYVSLHYGLVDNIFIFTYAVAFYIVKSAVPFGLSVMHYYPGTQGGALPWQYYASLPFLAFIAWLLFRPNSLRKEIAFGVCFFLTTISIMLQIIPVGIAVTAERYTYMPYIGLFYIAGQWISDIEKKQVKNLVIAGLYISIIIFSYHAWKRIGAWQDGETLFADVIKKYPNSHHGYWIRGNVKYRKGDMIGALQDYTKALEYNPRFAAALAARGCVYTILNEYKDALRDLNSAISMDATIAEAYNNRGWAHYELGDKAAAMQDYNKAILLNPAYADAYNNRGWAYYESGDRTSAIQDYTKAILLNPVYAEAYNNRGWAYYESGNVESAMQDFTKSILVNPLFAKAYYNRGALMVKTGDFAGAVDNFSNLLKLNPNDSIARFNRGVSYLNLKDRTSACEDLEDAFISGYAGAEHAVKKYCR